MKRVTRIAIYLVGLISLAMGNVCSVASGLGITATASFAYVLAEIVGMTLGTMTIITFGLFIVLQLFLTDQKNYAAILLQFPFSLFFSWMIDVLLGIVTLGYDSIVMKIFMMLAGIFFTSAGVILTVDVRLVPTAPDGTVRTISDRFHWEMGNVKNGFDLILVAGAIALGLIVRGRLTGVGIGTVIAALLTGRLVKWGENRFGRYFEKLCAAEKSFR